MADADPLVAVWSDADDADLLTGAAMIRRLFVAASLACLVLVARPVISQDTPLTRLVPITNHAVETETGFLRDAVARLWRISKPADHHRAAVKISCPNGFAGSGGIIRTVDDKGFVVVTNHHVIAGNEGRFVDVIGMGGTRTNGKVIWWDSKADVAVIYNANGGRANGFPVYDGAVPIGSQVEIVAMGGPGRMVPEEDIRPFTGNVVRTSYPSAICVDAYTVSGDSGASILYGGAICGVNWGHYEHPQVQVQGWSAGKPLSSHVDGPWLARTLTRVCQPLGCRPVIRGPGQIVVEPPANGQQPQPIAQAEPGPPGPAGPAGKDGLDGKDAEVTAEQLGAIAAAITQQLKADPSLRGPQGVAGTAGKDAIISPEQIKQALADYFANDPLTVTFVIRNPVTGEVEGVDVARVIPESKLTDELQPLVRDALQIVLPVER